MMPFLFSKRFILLALLGVIIPFFDFYFFQLFPANTLTRQDFIQLVFLAALAEEIIFRGLLQNLILTKLLALRSAFGPISLSNLCTSIIFALSHLAYHQDPAALMTFFPSLVFGHLSQHFKSLAPAILMHMIYNTCYFAAPLLLAN